VRSNQSHLPLPLPCPAALAANVIAQHGLPKYPLTCCTASQCSSRFHPFFGARLAIHVSQSKPHAIRNPLRLLKMQVNIRERNKAITAITAISPLSPVFVRVRTVRLQSTRLRLGLAGTWDRESRFRVVLEFIGIADQALAEFEPRFVNLERSNPGLESRARNPEPSCRPRGSGNPASGLG
jgi:hypothetical protein